MSETDQNSEPSKEQLPEFGEYAPEGWSFEAGSGHADVVQQSSDGAAGAAGVAVPANLPASLPGVPHNLGVGAARSASAHVAQTHDTQAQNVPTNNASAHNASQLVAGDKKPISSNIVTDRIFTVVLLVLGAMGSLNLALSAMTMGQQLQMVASAAGLGTIELPAVITVIESLGALSILSIFAVALLWSVHRMRRSKITFWLPLAAAVLSFVVLTVLALIAMLQVPELLTSLTPETIDQILGKLKR